MSFLILSMFKMEDSHQESLSLQTDDVVPYSWGFGKKWMIYGLLILASIIVVFFVYIVVRYRRVRNAADRDKKKAENIEFVAGSQRALLASETSSESLGSTELTVYNRVEKASIPDFPLLMIRSNSATNVDGAFSLTNAMSGTLYISSTSGVHEVVIYKYPSYEIAFAETNISEVCLNFLGVGEYICWVFSVSDSATANLKLHPRPLNISFTRPLPKLHRDVLPAVAKIREDRILGAIKMFAPPHSDLILTVESQPSTIWPKPMYTRVESIFATIPDEATAIFLSVPSYGYVVNGALEHLGPIVHEIANCAIYRVVSKPITAAGSTDNADLFMALRNTKKSVVSLRVVYPEISPSCLTVSPMTKIFVFSPRV